MQRLCAGGTLVRATGKLKVGCADWMLPNKSVMVSTFQVERANPQG